MASGGGINTDILSDETFDLLCSMCKNQGRNIEAEKYCADCPDYYCLACVKVHSQVPTLMGHKILDKGQFQHGSTHGLPTAPTQRCNRHSHKHIDMYCQNHDDVGCSTCMAVDHRSCKDMFYIPQFIQSNPNKVASKDVQMKLKAITKTLTEKNHKFQLEKQRLLKRKAQVLADISRFRKEINDRLDELERSSVNKVEDKFKTLIGKIDDGMKQLQEHTASVTSAKAKLASSGINASEKFVEVKKGEKVAGQATKCIEDNKMSTEEITFRAYRDILAMLGEVDTLGELTKVCTEAVEYKPATKTQQNNDLLKIKGRKRYNIRTQSDKRTCDIVSACTLEDGTIILADINNKVLKHLESSTYTIIKSCHLPCYPWQVCPINRQEVAVSLEDQQEVHFISTGSIMNTTRKVNTGFRCRGLAYADGNLYITDQHSSVYMYSLLGKVLKQFYSDQPGQCIFFDIIHLAISKDASKIYVTDFNKGLIVFDRKRKLVLKFNDQQLQGAYGCYLTETGSVLVSGGTSKNLLQFDSNGKLIGEVLKSCIKNDSPQAICCNQQMSKMIIGRYSDDFIDVYDI